MMIKDNIMDMHIHTTNSDGEYSLKQMIEKIKEASIGTFSITDHDNIDSHLEIKNLELGSLEYYNGVEISSIYQNYGMHILGYDLNPTEELVQLLEDIKLGRDKRFMDMIEMLYQRHGIKIEDELIQNILESSVALGKPHIKRLLFKLGYGKTEKEVYDKYLKGYKSKIKYRVDLDRAIDVIKKSNGIVVLAHPKEIEDDYHINIESIMNSLVQKGIDGIEVYNSIHSLEDVKRYLELAKNYNLFISGGSDYHGPLTKPTVELGKVSKEKIVVKKLSLVEELRRRNQK